MKTGIDPDGNKDVLGIWSGENESTKFWLSVLNELRNRGVYRQRGQPDRL